MFLVFCALTDDLGWPEIDITHRTQTVHVPGCPNPQFFVRFHAPIKVNYLLIVLYILPCSLGFLIIRNDLISLGSTFLTVPYKIKTFLLPFGFYALDDKYVRYIPFIFRHFGGLCLPHVQHLTYMLRHAFIQSISVTECKPGWRGPCFYLESESCLP